MEAMSFVLLLLLLLSRIFSDKSRVFCASTGEMEDEEMEEDEVEEADVSGVMFSGFRSRQLISLAMQDAVLWLLWYSLFV